MQSWVGPEVSFAFFVSPIDKNWDDLPREAVVDILYRGATTKDELDSVWYEDESGAREISGLDDWDQTSGYGRALSFRRFGGRTMMNRIYELADRLDGMMYWPGDAPFVAVTRHELFDRLPPDLDRAFATVVRDVDHLLACIK